jgi:NAD(P)H-quinone oxidoreductase subunit 5
MTVAFLQAAWLIPVYPLLAAVASLAWSPGVISRTGPRP